MITLDHGKYENMNLHELLLVGGCTLVVLIVSFLIMEMVDNFLIGMRICVKITHKVFHLLETIAAQFWSQYGTYVKSKLKRIIIFIISHIKKGG